MLVLAQFSFAQRRRIERRHRRDQGINVGLAHDITARRLELCHPVSSRTPVFNDQPLLLEELIVSLFRVASFAPTGQTAMVSFIKTLADLFGFSDSDFERLKSLGLNGADSGAAGADGAVPYLAVLGLAEGASAAEAKRAYHKLAMANHPDKLMAAGVPPEFIAQANEKLTLINLAYEQFQAAQAGRS